ncbi:LysR family transcriptional regulator [Pseudonocardia ailaonensis]|uniref:LysR family transcriptional regulator n=1 Tax=Pseudonocardia ailaonensis TaxID=367279 RepID=A0ABN2N776_9PSEU
MTGVLDIVALRSLVAIADHGGFHRAATVLQLSQSAVSQHVRRLEKVVGFPLVRRDGRVSRFTSEGTLLLEDARRVLAAHDHALDRIGAGRPRPALVLGSTEHAADELLPRVTRALGEVTAGSMVRYRFDRSSMLNEAVDRGDLDLAMYIGERQGSDSHLVGALPLRWLAAPGWTPAAPGDTIPLVVIDQPCTIRRRALQSLADSGYRSTVVGEAAYLAGVLNAARAGLGVALIAGDGTPDGLVPRTDLPAVQPENLYLRGRAGLDARLVEAAKDALAESLVEART